MDTTVSLTMTERGEKVAEVAADKLGQRVLVWIDAVGGYLVCLGSTITIGQASPDSPADVALMADLSRTHARLTREDDLYVLTPLAKIRIAGVQVHSDRLLRDGDELELGPTVVVRFRQPHPLSSTARLELISPHRPQPAADGIILMGQSLVLGPAATSHIVCKDWQNNVLLSRKSAETWICRSEGTWQVDGRPTTSPAELTLHSRVCGEDFCFSLEPLE